MPLGDHLRELRSRVVKAAIAIILGGIVGWFLYDPLLDALIEPIQVAAAENGREASINFTGVSDAFDLKVRVSLWLGIFVASPVWLYQLWAFVTPGLSRKERRYALAFVTAAVPLFFAGAYLAWQFLPQAVAFLTAFTPEGGSNFIEATLYLGFVMRILLVFGIAFMVPLLLVALNLIGLLSGRAIVGAWRWVVVVCFAVSAMATPTPDVTLMFLLALPLLALFAVAAGIALLTDRRRASQSPEPDFSDLADDEASPL